MRLSISPSGEVGLDFNSSCREDIVECIRGPNS